MTIQRLSRTNPLLRNFEDLEALVRGVIDGDYVAVAAFGPPGIGKGYFVGRLLKHLQCRNYRICANPTVAELIRAAWEMRDGGVLLICNADHLILAGQRQRAMKTLFNRNQDRFIYYDGDNELPKKFRTRVRFILLSDIDIESDYDPRLNASPQIRKYVWELTWKLDKTVVFSFNPAYILDYVLWLATERQMLRSHCYGSGLAVKNDMLRFFCENAPCLREISIRTLFSIGELRQDHPETWQDMAQERFLGDVRRRLVVPPVPVIIPGAGIPSPAVMSPPSRDNVFMDIARCLGGRFDTAFVCGSENRITVRAADKDGILFLDTEFPPNPGITTGLSIGFGDRKGVLWVQVPHHGEIPTEISVNGWDVEIPASDVAIIKERLLLAAKSAMKEKKRLFLHLEEEKLTAHVGETKLERIFELFPKVVYTYNCDFEGCFSPEALCWLMRKNVTGLRVKMKTSTLGITVHGATGEYDFYLRSSY